MYRAVEAMLLVIAVAGCGRSRCDEIADEGRDVLEKCGVEFGDFNGGHVSEEDCSEEIVTIEECVLECYRSFPCSAFLKEDKAQHAAFIECIKAC